MMIREMEEFILYQIQCDKLQFAQVFCSYSNIYREQSWKKVIRRTMYIGFNYFIKITDNINIFHQMRGSPNKNIKYIDHTLNDSKSKTSFSFHKSKRFVQDKSYSPNKFYNIPSTISQRGSTMGFGNKTTFENANIVEPTRYRISSDFDKSNSKKPKFTTFGISRDEYYKGKSSANLVGPGAYSIQGNKKRNSVYMGSRFEPPLPKHTASATTYDVKEEALNRLSTFRNNEKSCRIKTEYYPKNRLHDYDNHTPGPGSYYQEISDNSSFLKSKSKPYIFGKEERIKKDKHCKIGPGSYHQFSQFGYP